MKAKVSLAVAAVLGGLFAVSSANAGDLHRQEVKEEFGSYKGSHRTDFSEKALYSYLSGNGFYNIDIDNDLPVRYEVEACREGKKWEIHLSPEWKLLRKDEEGKCKEHKGHDKHHARHDHDEKKEHHNKEHKH